MGKTVRRRARAEIDLDAVWDIETENWDTFVCGGLLLSDGTYEEYTWIDERKFFERLRDFKGHLWAHNAGRFDDKWHLDWSQILGEFVECVSAGSRIVVMRVRDAIFCDSKAVVPISLEKMSKIGGQEKCETGLTCECGSECGGYCVINRWMPGDRLRRLMDYMKQDCVALMNSMKAITEFAKRPEVDIDIGLTVGSSAWKNVRRLLDIRTPDWSAGVFKATRAGYYGGRVQVLRPFAALGFEYDVNSMYPSRLAAFPVPVGQPWACGAKEAAALFSRDRPGVYKAKVWVPDMHLPPLPLRAKGRIYYPTGEFVGSWAKCELDYAMSLGVQVDILEGVVFPKEQVVFTAWVERLFALRENAPGGKKGPIGEWLKFYLNSLTGKFGSKPEHQKIEINPPTLHACPCTSLDKIKRRNCDCGGVCCERCVGECGAHTRLGLSPHVWGVYEWSIQPCAMPHWAAYLTAEARVEWHRFATQLNQGWDAIYGDTDSVFCIDKRENNVVFDTTLGKWQCQGSFKNFTCMAPKMYFYERGDDHKDFKKGPLQIRAKGVRLPSKGGEIDTQAAKSALLSGVSIGGIGGIVGVRSGARTGRFFETAEVKRKARVRLGKNGERFYGDRILEVGKEVTRAPMATEVAQ